MYNKECPSKTWSKADLRALRMSELPDALLETGVKRFDSADDASLFFARELDYIKTKVYETQYPQFNALRLFPHTSDVDAGALTTTWYSYDKVGTATVIQNYATDLPRADAFGEPNTVYIKSLGDAYGYSVQEMRASSMTGKSLDVQKGKAAHYQIDYLENKIAWAGDPANKLQGVLTPDNNIPLYTLSTVSLSNGGTSTKWADKTADQVIDEINAMQKYVNKLTKGVEKPDVLALPSDVFMDVSTRRVPDTETTIKDYILDHAPYLKSIEEAAELNDDSYDTNPLTSALAPKGVAFMYTNSAEKFSIETPMPFYQHALQVRNLEAIIPCEARTAGVIIYYPLSALIAVGV